MSSTPPDATPPTRAPEPRSGGTLFAPPPWLRDIGWLCWLLVGLGAVLVGATWVLAETSSIVTPVVTGTIVAAVAGPGVGALQRRGVHRAIGALLTLLALIALAVVIVIMVVAGIADQGDEISAAATQAADTIEGWAKDAGADDTSQTRADVESSVTGVGDTLVHGIASGIQGLTSLAFFLSFTLFSTFFLLKDGPQIRRFIDRNLGVPRAVATVVTGEVLHSLRRYFLGVSTVAAFNAIVVGIAALVLDVPLAGTIAVVTLVTAYVPFIGAVVSGAFAVMIALGSSGTTVALIMLVVVLLANGLLQNVVQPIAFGATLDLNPLAVLVVTIAFGSLFGMVGLVLGAPLTSAALHIRQRLRQPPAPA